MIRKLLFLSATAAMAATPALSQEVEVSGNVALTTDYHWRGQTQSNKDLAIQGGFDVAAGGLYLGTWASSIDFGDSSDTNIELDIYGGYAGDLGGGLGYDVGIIGYIYPDADDEDLDFAEIYGALSYSTEVGLDFGGSLNWDPDNETLYTDFSVGYGVTEAFSVDAGIGTWIDGGDDGAGGTIYPEEVNYNIGATYSVGGVDLDIRWYDLDDDSVGESDNVVLTIARAM